MIGCIANRDRRAQFVAGTDEDAQLQLEILRRLGREFHGTVGQLELTMWPGKRMTADAHRCGAAVIGDRQMLEGGRQAFGQGHAPCVIDRAEIIGEAADGGGKLHDGIGLRHQQSLAQRLDLGAVRRIAAQQVRQLCPQGRSIGVAQRHQRIEIDA